MLPGVNPVQPYVYISTTNSPHEGLSRSRPLRSFVYTKALKALRGLSTGCFAAHPLASMCPVGGIFYLFCAASFAPPQRRVYRRQTRLVDSVSPEILEILEFLFGVALQILGYG